MMTVMYLPKDEWSPRFDSTFFSVKLESTQICTSPPAVREGICGKTNTPAVYYQVAVFCEHRKITFLRRYSNFKWLYDQLKASPPPPVQDDLYREPPPLNMPPGTCFFHSQDDAFIQNRKEQLMDFIDDALILPGYAQHPAVILFFELDSFDNKSA
jgi:hypothetical protein